MTEATWPSEVSGRNYCASAVTMGADSSSEM
jgi:hypothetical protein